MSHDVVTIQYISKNMSYDVMRFSGIHGIYNRYEILEGTGHVTQKILFVFDFDPAPLQKVAASESCHCFGGLMGVPQ